VAGQFDGRAAQLKDLRQQHRPLLQAMQQNR
jgi:hypothetical protein